MSVLNYSGLQHFYDNLVTKFADAGALATLQNQTNDISDLLDTLNSLFTTWKEENFSVSNNHTFFEGISKNIKITSARDSTESIFLVGTNVNVTSNASYSLHSLYANAYLTQAISSDASTPGTTTLILGNSTSTSNSYDTQGQIKLYGPSTNAAILSYEDSSASYVSLPRGGESGAPAVLALKSEVTDVVNSVDIVNDTLETLNTSVQDNADDIATINSDLTTINSTLSSLPNVYATPSYVDGKISDLLGGATEAELNTLKELSDALNDDANFATTVTTELGNKALKTDLDLLVKKSGDTMAGDLTISKTGGPNTSFAVENDNGSVALRVGTNRGIYDITNNKWAMVCNNGTTDWMFKGTADLAKKLQSDNIIGEFENQTTVLGWRIAGPYSSTDSTTVALSLRVNKDTGVIQARVDSKAGTLYPQFYTTANKPTASGIGAVAKAGDTMSGNLSIEKTTAVATSVTITNPNRKISLSVHSNAGLYDDTNSKWILSSPTNSTAWTFHGKAENVTGTVAVANGGTGATTAANARANLGITMGQTSIISFAANHSSDIKDVTINFGKTYSSAPKVFLSPYYNNHTNSADIHKVWYEVISVNTTSCIARVLYPTSSTSVLNLYLNWIAIG